MSSPYGGPPPGWPPPGPQYHQGPPAQAPQGWPPQRPQGWPPPAPQGPYPAQGPYPGQPQWPQIQPVPRKSNRGVVIAVIAVVAVLGLGLLAVLAGAVLGSDSKSAGGADVSDEERLANAKTAASFSDFDAVCENGSVSNAASYEKPYKVAAFYEGARESSWYEVSLDFKAEYRGMPDALAQINVVACLTRKPGTEVKSGSCEYESGGTTVDVDRYAIEYDLVIHEAKSGKVIENLGTVKGPANGCPVIVTFDKKSPKIYGSPDADAVDEKVADWVAG